MGWLSKRWRTRAHGTPLEDWEVVSAQKADEAATPPEDAAADKSDEDDASPFAFLALRVRPQFWAHWSICALLILSGVIGGLAAESRKSPESLTTKLNGATYTCTRMKAPAVAQSSVGPASAPAAPSWTPTGSPLTPSATLKIGRACALWSRNWLATFAGDSAEAAKTLWAATEVEIAAINAGRKKPAEVAHSLCDAVATPALRGLRVLHDCGRGLATNALSPREPHAQLPIPASLHGVQQLWSARMVWRFWSTASCEEAATAEPTEAPAAEEVAVVEEEVVVEEAEEPKRVLEVKTAPFDPRFPMTNQAKKCYTNYNEFHKCAKEKDAEDPACQKFASFYRSVCPTEWVEKWNEQRENGNWAGRY